MSKNGKMEKNEKKFQKKIEKNKIIKTLLFLLLIFILFCFYKINGLNYKKHIEIKNNIVNHPESIPKKEVAGFTSFGFKNLRADIYWLETIQYIGGNAISSEYKKYLYIMLDLITQLNPYFEHPYIIGELLLPSYNERYEKLEKEEQNINIDQSINIGLKGIKNFCNAKVGEKGELKINLIEKEFNLKKIWTNEKYKNPCKSYSIAYYLAYIYYFYKHDGIKSSIYYKIASANEDSVEGAKTMAAIMQGKGGDREKSVYMFLDLAKNIEKEDSICIQFSNELENTFNGIISKNIELNDILVEKIENIRKNVFEEINEENDEEFLGDTKCKNYANKAIREINLLFIENANKKYKIDNNGKSARNAKVLQEKGYIKFLPTDFQQYKDYGIIYEYNKDLGHFDYEMGSYEE